MTVTGLSSQRIVEVAEQENALMIIMGSRGRSRLPHWLIGFVVEPVTRYCPRPVTIIKDTDFGEHRRTGLTILHSFSGEPVPENAASL